MLSLTVRDDRDNALVEACLFEINSAINQGIESIVLANTHVVARIVLSTALTHDNVSCDALLTTPNLDA